MKSYSVSIIIPIYRSADSLKELYKGIKDEMELLNVPFELIMIDDASPDNSWKVMKKLKEKDSRVKIIRFSKNFGQHPALLCGMSYATGDYIITMDDDLQNPPSEISKLLNAIKNDSKTDVYIGDYYYKKHNWLRNIATFIINILTSYIFEKDRNLKLTSFRIMRSRLVKDILTHKTESPRIGQIILMVTDKIKNVKVKHNPRKYGSSKYTFKKLFKDFFDSIIINSSFPLKLLSCIGLFIFSLSFFLVSPSFPILINDLFKNFLDYLTTIFTYKQLNTKFLFYRKELGF